MYWSFIPHIISMILFTNLYLLVHCDNDNIPSKFIAENPNDKDNETHNGSFSLMVRMIAFGIQRTDDDDDAQQKLIHTELPSNKDRDRFEGEELQQNTRLLFLPLMIRMLFDRLAEHTDPTEQTKDIQKSYEINYQSKTNKQNIVYASVKRFIMITIDVNKVEKTTIILFLTLSFAIFLLTIFSIIRRLRDTHKFHIVRVGSSSVNSKINHEETKKLLP